jgi:hypothetical protein
LLNVKIKWCGHYFLLLGLTIAKPNNSIGPANGTNLSGGSGRKPADNSGGLISGSNGGKMLPGIAVSTDPDTVKPKSGMLVLSLGLGACGVLAAIVG